MAEAATRFGAGFLACPELFPARMAGEGWGTERVTLAFPGGTYQLTDLAAAQAQALLARFSEFLAPATTGEVVPIHVYRVPATDFLPARQGWYEYTLDLGAAEGSVAVAGEDFMGRLEWRPGLQAGLWTHRSTAPEVEGVAENLLRVVAAYRLLETGSAMIHSAGIVRGGQAVLAVGRSGAGKTTLCHLGQAAGHRILSDELNVVELGGDGVRLRQVPFAGDFGRSSRHLEAVPLRAICRLEKGAADRLEPLSRGQALALLLSATPFVNRDRYRSGALEAVLAEVAARVPTFTLGFSLDSDLAVLDELLVAAEVA